MRALPTRRPLGAQPSGDGTSTTFRVYSATARRVELCLIDADPLRRSVTELRLEMHRDHEDPHIWCAQAPVGPGTRYGYRAHGEFDVERGLRANPAKLLLDPYGRYVEEPRATTSQTLELLRDADRSGHADGRDTLRVAPWSVVCAQRPPVASTRPVIPRGCRVIYEAHLGHLTRQLPDVDTAVRGTFAALRSAHLVEHLQSMGVTTLELLPVMHSTSEPHLVAQGRRNVWGYNPLGFFSPAGRFCAAGDMDGQWDEIAGAVRHLHAAGIELVLDVVYNHTAEGPAEGPTYHLRGLDNPSYYRLEHGTGRYSDVTGCGNTLDAAQPPVQDLIVDSLRHWVRMTDVDGFRFDLAPVLGRAPAFAPNHPLLERIGTDELIGDRLLIAEPWDLGPDGHHTGGFTDRTLGGGWLEWNDSCRNAIRDFWRPGPGGRRSRLVSAMAGSSDIFRPRDARSSVGYVTAHDGFTLRDLVSYNRKHNEANGEDNRDGSDDNRSWNGGVEGDTDDPLIAELRLRRQAAMLACVMLQVGTPMIAAGDELNRTQRGNNNPYCLDDASVHLDWTPTGAGVRLTGLMQSLAAVRREHASLFDGAWLTAPEHSQAGHAVHWLSRQGERIDDDRWDDDPRVLVVHFPGASARGPLLIALNGTDAPVEVRLPDAGIGPWRVGIDTALSLPPGTSVEPGAPLRLDSCSLVVLAD